MTIFRSIAVGKARKSAGDLTYYTRLGINCFRAKPTRSESFRPSIGQLKQQKIYKFMKANIDANYLKTFINLLTDAKPKSGKGQTKMNIFYQSVMPQLVAQKEEIYALTEEEMVNADIFMGINSGVSQQFTKGVLGDLPVTKFSTAQNVKITIPEVAVNSFLATANQNLASSDTPFTLEDLFIAAVTEQDGVMTLDVDYPTAAAAEAADGVVTCSPVGTKMNGLISANSFLVLVVGRTAATGGLDTTQKYYCTNAVYVTADNA